MGTIPRPNGFAIEGEKHMKELKNKLDMGFNKSLEKMRIGNPIGMGLPLIEALVKGTSVEIVIP
jgi:hypothetical protein